MCVCVCVCGTFSVLDVQFVHPFSCEFVLFAVLLSEILPSFGFFFFLSISVGILLYTILLAECTLFFLEIYGIVIQKIRILSHYHVANLC